MSKDKSFADCDEAMIFAGRSKEFKALNLKINIDGTEEKAIRLCKELRKNKLSDGWAAFAMFTVANVKHSAENAKKIVKDLQKIMDDKRGITEMNDWITLQYAMRYISGAASEEFKDKVENDQ